MDEKQFRMFGAVAIVVMFILIGWAIFHHLEHDLYDHRNSKHIRTPLFEWRSHEEGYDRDRYRYRYPDRQWR